MALTMLARLPGETMSSRGGSVLERTRSGATTGPTSSVSRLASTPISCGSAVQMVVQGWYLNTIHELQGISLADGKTLLAADVQQLVDAMASFAPPDAGQTQYTPQERQVLQPLLASSWN